MSETSESYLEITNKKTGKSIIFDSQLITALMKCPRYYDYTFNLCRRTLGGKSNPLECGSIVHTILEFYYKAKKEGKPRNEAIDIGFISGREYLSPYLSSNKYVTDPKHEGIKNTPKESSNKPKKTGWEYVFKTMEQYFHYWGGRDEYEVIGVEEVRGRIIYEDDELVILYKAKFDLIELHPQIGELGTDHKTMSQVRDTISLNNQFIGQNVILGTRRVQINKIGWQTSLEPHEKFLRPLITYSADRLVEWTNEIIPYYSRMLLAYDEAKYYPPNFSQCEDKYGYCNFKNVCEHDRNSRMLVLEKEYEEVEKWDVEND